MNILPSKPWKKSYYTLKPSKISNYKEGGKTVGDVKLVDMLQRHITQLHQRGNSTQV